MEVFFYPPPLAGGGCERDSGRGGWSVSDDVWDFATPQKFALRIFTPPRKRRRVRFRLSPEWNIGREWKGGGMEVFFYPPPLAGGGASAIAVAGGWSVADDVWDFATPQKFALRIFTPPRKRRRVRFRLSPEWNMEREWKKWGDGKVREWKYFFTPRRLRGGASAIAVAGGGVFPMMFGTSPPPKNSPCEFLPPPASGGG